MSLMSVLYKQDTAVISIKNKKIHLSSWRLHYIWRRYKHLWPDMLYHEKYQAAQLLAKEISFRWGGQRSPLKGDSRDVLLEKVEGVRLPRRPKVFVKPEAGKRLTCSKDQREAKLFRAVDWTKPCTSRLQTKRTCWLILNSTTAITDSYKHSVTKTSPHAAYASARSHTHLVMCFKELIQKDRKSLEHREYGGYFPDYFL